MRLLTIWSNTRLDEQRAWPVDTLVDLFTGSRFSRLPGDPAARLQLFLTDQDGPVRGVCCDATALDGLITALADRETVAGKDAA